MATRSIVTSQPDVECDVCERRLLRGEQPDVFIAAGRRHLVCELCAPRAVQEGWMRETGEPAQGPSAPRQRRRRGLLGRLTTRRPERASGPANALHEPDPQAFVEPLLVDPQASYDFLDAHVPAQAGELPDAGPHGVAQPVDRTHEVSHEAPEAMDGAERTHEDGMDPADPSQPFAGAVADVDEDLQHAVGAFNAGEHPRRVAGVARSLGEPIVSVRHSEHAPGVIAIVIAWELCWYRYEVDLDEAPSVARAVGQGAELHELARAERAANAVAEESGTLRLSPPGALSRP